MFHTANRLEGEEQVLFDAVAAFNRSIATESALFADLSVINALANQTPKLDSTNQSHCEWL